MKSPTFQWVMTCQNDDFKDGLLPLVNVPPCVYCSTSRDHVQSEGGAGLVKEVLITLPLLPLQHTVDSLVLWSLLQVIIFLVFKLMQLSPKSYVLGEKNFISLKRNQFLMILPS